MLIPTFLCPKAWEGMAGDETTRYCSYCRKHVHNLEAMPVRERLALLASPAASICSRYRIAIRRPAKGKEESYRRHMLKYGASVALAGSVLLVLWEMHEQAGNRTWYRAAAGMQGGETRTSCGWPPELYDEQEVVLLGALAFPDAGTVEPKRPEGDPGKISHVDLDLDPALINRLRDEMKPAAAGPRPIVPMRSE